MYWNSKKLLNWFFVVLKCRTCVYRPIIIFMISVSFKTYMLVVLWKSDARQVKKNTSEVNVFNMFERDVL